MGYYKAGNSKDTLYLRSLFEEKEYGDVCRQIED
ncbi:hypothetical protein EDD64_1091 [Effusibacillus lacus]|nr:hypothetical protein EDD64_1091 [Effusibacillus lacus]